MKEKESVVWIIIFNMGEKLQQEYDKIKSVLQSMVKTLTMLQLLHKGRITILNMMKCKTVQ